MTEAQWTQPARPSRGVLVVLTVTVLLLVAAGVVAALVGARSSIEVLFFLLAVVVIVSALDVMFWRVSIDSAGLGVRSLLGVPRFVVPFAAIESAEVIPVRPLRTFYGYGLRWPKRNLTGIITRAGSGLKVTRTDGRVLVVTVSQAAEAAALLNSRRRTA